MWVPMLVCIYSMYSLILWKFYKFQGRRKPLNCGCAVYLVNQYFSRQNLGLSKGSSQNVGVQLHTLHTRFRRPCNTCQNFYDPILKPVLKLLRYINQEQNSHFEEKWSILLSASLSVSVSVLACSLYFLWPINRYRPIVKNALSVILCHIKQQAQAGELEKPELEDSLSKRFQNCPEFPGFPQCTKGSLSSLGFLQGLPEGLLQRRSKGLPVWLKSK